jgi:Ca-activated chloride channel homolog
MIMNILCSLFLASMVPSMPIFQHSGDRLYREGKFPDAAAIYRKQYQKDPKNSLMGYNLASALYKSGEKKDVKALQESEKVFSKLLEEKDLDSQERVFYDLGNVAYRLGELADDPKKKIAEWERSLKFYQNALDLKPAEDTKHNYEFVKRKLEEQKKQEQKKECSCQNQQNKDQNKDNPQQNPQNKDQKQQNQQKKQDQNQKQDKNREQQKDQQKQQNQQPKEKPQQQDQQKSPQDQSQQKKDQQQQQSPQSQPQPQQQKKPSSASENKQQSPRREGSGMTEGEAKEMLDRMKQDEKNLPMATGGDKNEQGSEDVGRDW